MKKALPYIIGVAVLIFLAVVIVAGSKRLPRKMDERITLKQEDKIPYGTAAAKSLLPFLFTHATVYYDDKAPGYWDSVQATSYNQAVILVCNYFNADEYELRQLLSFVENGNYVFIAARSFSLSAQDIFNFSYSENQLDDILRSSADSLMVKLEKPSFSSDQNYVYPGKKYESWFYSLDTPRVTVLGRNSNGKADFIRLNRGSGAIFVHTAPLAFSNYFILHKSNIRYFQNALSVIPANIEKIDWNEYYLTKPDSSDEKEPNWLGVLFRYPPFKWGLLTAIFTLLLYVLLGSRRRQRLIPTHQKPRNDSLDFVKTLGRLYYDRRDHRNLAKKMAVYFLEHVRSVYKLPAHELGNDLVQQLHYKTGYDAEKIEKIISFISYLDEVPFIPETELIAFHKQLESFYQNT